MKTDIKADAKRVAEDVPNSPERRIRAIGVEKDADVPRRGSWLSRWAAPLVATLAVGCGSVVSDDDQDVDSGDQADVPEMVDTEDVDAQEDYDDEGVAPDIDVGPDSDAIEAGDDAEDTPVEVEDGVGPDDAEPETDAGCTETTHIEPDSLPGPVNICGSTQTTTTEVEVTTRTGDGCEAPGTTRTVVRKAVILTPPLDVGNLGCARGARIRALNDQETIVGLGADSLESAREIVRANMSPGGPRLDGGVGEYKIEMRMVNSSNVNVRVYNASEEIVIFSLTINGTGYATINVERGAIAWDFIDSVSAFVAMIILPTNARTNGSEEYFVSGDGARFRFYTNVLGSELRGWEWVRE